MDPLSALLVQAAPYANIFFAGNLCQQSHSHDYPAGGHLHLLRSGELKLYQQGEEPVVLSEPTLIFFPSGRHHRLEPLQLGGCDLVCAAVSFEQKNSLPLKLMLPDTLILPLRALPSLATVLALLFDEAFAERYAQQPLISRLIEVLLILLLRHMVEQEICQQGMLAGLSDPRLAKAIGAMHLRSDERWTVESLAREAGMSRARFAAHFQAIIGSSPFGYLTQWRMARACQQLRTGEPIAQVALAAGYSGSVAFSRAFERELGMSPGRWLKQNE